LYSILIKFGVPMKVVRLIKMCSKVCMSKHWPQNFLFKTAGIIDCSSEVLCMSVLVKYFVRVFWRSAM
jgi:hypothetical protein